MLEQNNKDTNMCKKYKAMISLYVDNLLTDDQSHSLLDHTNICVGCKTELANMYSIKAMIRNEYRNNNKVSINIASKVMSKVNNKVAEDEAFQNKEKIKIWCLSAVATVMISLFTVIFFYSQVKEDNLMAEQRIYDSYVVDHVVEYVDDSVYADYNVSPQSDTILAVSYER